jgi:LDH2 family malate/lactate/ureidoglycolate dehydrogenase
MPVEEFNNRMLALTAIMKATAPAFGFTEVLMAGDPEKRLEAQRLASGIDIPEGNWKDLTDGAARLGVSVPAIPVT